MKQYVKSYHLFLSQRWLRWGIYIIYPLLLSGSFGWLGSKISADPSPATDPKSLYTLLFFVLGNTLILVELFSDTFIFGGIADKNTNKLEYLKTSTKGMPCLRKALVTDAARRLISLGIIVGCCSLSAHPFYDLADASAILLMLFSFIETGLIITRHFPTLSVTFIVISVISFLMPASLSWIQLASPQLKLLLPTLTGITATVLGRWLILKKARNSYYDNRNEKSL